MNTPQLPLNSKNTSIVNVTQFNDEGIRLPRMMFLRVCETDTSVRWDCIGRGKENGILTKSFHGMEKCALHTGNVHCTDYGNNAEMERLTPVMLVMNNIYYQLEWVHD